MIWSELKVLTAYFLLLPECNLFTWTRFFISSNVSKLDVFIVTPQSLSKPWAQETAHVCSCFRWVNTSGTLAPKIPSIATKNEKNKPPNQFNFQPEIWESLLSIEHRWHIMTENLFSFLYWDSCSALHPSTIIHINIFAVTYATMGQHSQKWEHSPSFP